MPSFDLHTSKEPAIAQLPMHANRLLASCIKNGCGVEQANCRTLLRYNEVLLDHARITAACNALHHAEARFCRWLLQTRDRAESNTILLTQEFLSEMLGVRRTSVTDVASKMQSVERSAIHGASLRSSISAS